jgi:ParB-like chromosome segregation protein Spo0J
MVKPKYLEIEAQKLRLLRKNPQYLTPKQMDSLKRSIERDGFLAPIVVRKIENDEYEIVSGNHRFMAGKELGMTEYPVVLIDMSEMQCKRIAMNLNTIHGDPPAELIAPFLADLPDEILIDIHLDKQILKEVLEFDDKLKVMLDEYKSPDEFSRATPGNSEICKCLNCGRVHLRMQK